MKPCEMNQYKNIQPNILQQGFTLVELMISLVLGLLITAAVIQVYFINVKTLSTQKSSSELQNVSVFGLEQVENHIRLANLGNSVTEITDDTRHGGIVLTGFNLGDTRINTTTNKLEDKYPDTDSYLTRTAGEAKGSKPNAWDGISNINGVDSDQLTIQYKNITGKNMVDCEGKTVDKNDWVIERYFLRQKTGVANTGNIKKLVLACDAGRVTFNAADEFQSVDDFGDTGETIIEGIDQFKILLGVQGIDADATKDIAKKGSQNYVSTTVYKDLTEKPTIISVKMAVLASGNTPTKEQDRDTFTIFGKDNVLKTDANRDKLVRNTYETTMILRNARVMPTRTMADSY